MCKILFIMKYRENYSQTDATHQKGMSTGLYNSVDFIVKTFPENCSAVSVIDNNDIDREVTQAKPDIVIIEGLWVVPEKFHILAKLHPKVKWVIRTHSKTAFIAGEGMAIGWILKYIHHQNVYVAANSVDFYEDLIQLTRHDNKILYLPNIYPKVSSSFSGFLSDSEINVSCFGAIRPLKNQLLQAKAAIVFAEQVGRKLNFHINSNRVEMKGEAVLNNLRGMFEMVEWRGHKLIIHGWAPHDQFLDMIYNETDICMQVSLTETFNIVAADCVQVGKPVVGSNQIPWTWFNANPHGIKSMIRALKFAYTFPSVNHWVNKTSLNSYSEYSIRTWEEFIGCGM